MTTGLRENGKLAGLVLGVALVLRLVYLFAFAETRGPSQDEKDYLRAAHVLWEERVFGYDAETPTADIPVAYPLFLAPQVGLFGEGAGAILVIQAVTGALAAALLALAAACLGGRTAGLVTGVLAATYVPSMLFVARFLTETLALFWLALGLWLLTLGSTGRDGASRRLGMALGVTFALLALTRVITLPLILVAALALGYAASRKGRAGRGRALVLITLLAFGTVYGVWVVRNRVSLGRTIVLVEGEKEKVAAIAFHTAEGVRQGMGLTEARLYAREAAGDDFDPPDTTVKTKIKHFAYRLGVMAGVHPVLDLPFPFAGSRLPVAGWANGLHYLWHPFLLVGLLSCAVSGVRRLDPARLGLVMVPLALLLLHAVVHALPRYQLLVFFTWTAAAGVGWGELLGQPGWYCRWGKRSLDLLITTLALILLSPLMLLLGVAVLVNLGSPVLFRQQRPGKDARPFSIMKLRTLKEAFDEADEPLPDEARKTRLGELLRRLSLDELPELVNILRGEMSLVGPRPLLVEYLPRYTAEQARRHEVKPGITGWAQIHGRNLLSWEERFQRDVWYVDHISLGLDLRILVLTAWKVVAGEGISAEGHATMPRFRGTDGEGGT